MNIPVNELRGRLNELPKDKEIIVYCQVGLRAYLAARILEQNGFQSVKNLSGGYKTFQMVTKERDRLTSEKSQTEVASVAFLERAEIEIQEEKQEMTDIFKVNACGLQCPGPILQLFNKMQQLNDGEVLEIIASDPGFANDVEAWCSRTGNTLIKLEREPGKDYRPDS